jgi:hypothetical protein
MTHSVEATYENGVLKLHQPLPLQEHETVRVTVQTDRSAPTGSKPLVPPHDSEPIEAATPTSACDASADEPSDFGEYEMVDIWLDIPPSPDAVTVVARRGPLPLPDPPIIPPNDDEIE